MFAGLLFPAVFAQAQAVLPEPPIAPPTSPGSSSAVNTQATSSGDYSSRTTENMADRLFNVNSDSIDFENGSFQWKGRTFNLGNARLMRARFERYLAAPVPAGDNQQYRMMLEHIETLLSPATLTKSNFNTNMQDAWNLLFEAGKFEADGKNCITIATLVEKTAKQRTEAWNLHKSRNQERALQDEQRLRISMLEASKERQVDEAVAPSLASTKKNSSRPPPTYGNAEIGRQRELHSETQAIVRKVELSAEALTLRSKLEFQSQIVLFLLERRFHHAIIAAAFYRNLYTGSASNFTVGAKQLKEMFPISDLVLSIDSVDMLAREAIKDVDTGMKAVADTYDRSYRYEAFQRLQETFFLGEYMPDVMNYDPEKKRLMKDLWASLRDIQRMGDDRDLAGVEEALAKVKVMAADFPAVQIMSKVASAMNASNLAVDSAQLAAFEGNTTKAEAQLERAIKIWPTNPSVRKFTERLRSRTDVLAQLVPEFDRLEQSGQFREIYKRKEDFGFALLQDKTRIKRLKTIMANIGQLDAYLIQAKTLSNNGNPCVAWDIIQTAEQLGPNDPEFLRMRSDMAGVTANYARLLSESSKNENEGNFAAGLTAMLAAQALNPGSEFCRLGVQRLGEKLLVQMDAK